MPSESASDGIFPARPSVSAKLIHYLKAGGIFIIGTVLPIVQTAYPCGRNRPKRYAAHSLQDLL
ncbi:TPA: hypothetical protein WGQ52_000666 [Neisseria meningitidis]